MLIVLHRGGTLSFVETLETVLFFKGMYGYLRGGSLMEIG